MIVMFDKAVLYITQQDAPHKNKMYSCDVEISVEFMFAGGRYDICD
jgi:hypothetical protein